MDAFSKNKYLFWAVIILIILNIVMITGFFLERHHRHERPEMQFPPMINPEGFHSQDFISHELQFNDDQRKLFIQLTTKHFETISKLMDSISQKRKVIFDETFSQTPDSNKLNLLANEIGALHSEIEKSNYDHFSKLKGFCSDDQIAKLKNLMSEIIKLKPPMHMPPGPGCGGGPNGPGGVPGGHPDR